MKRRFFFTLCLLSALAAPAAHARQEPKPLRISYVRAPFNLQLMVMKEKGILQKHLESLGLQAQWPEITFRIGMVGRGAVLRRPRLRSH